MYKIIDAQGRELGKTERPYYIKIAANGSLAPCEERDAQGIALNGTVYALFGVEGFPPDLPRVVLTEADVGRELEAAAAVTSIAFVTLAEAGQIDPVTATENASQFAEWAYPVDYREGMIRRDPLDGNLYQVNAGQGHTSQQGWNPSLTPALWKKVGDPAEEWPAWTQPLGAHDAYEAGAKVSHNGERWTSDVGGNVWEPGVYGWTKYTKEAARGDDMAQTTAEERVDLDAMTIPRLKTYASEHKIDITGKTLKADILTAIKAAEAPGEVTV